jgi:MFS family permease
MLVLTLVGALVYGSNAIHGGFLSDAWATRASYVFAEHSTFFGGIDRFLEEPNISVRPLLAVLLSLYNTVLGGHQGFWLAALVATNIIMCGLLYLLLRRLSMGALDAAVVAVLVLVFPAAGALRLWAAMVAAPVTISLALIGFLIALAAFDREADRRKSLILHGVSLLFFVSSLLLYELALPVMMLSVLIYQFRAPWRPSIYRWLVDGVVLGTIALTVTHSSESGFTQEHASMFSHAGEIYSQLHTLFTTVVLPFDSPQWYLVVLLVLVPVTGAVVYWLLPKESETKPELLRWLTVMVAGAIVVLASYAIFIPALNYYVPLRVGDGSRINAMPSIGWVLMFYGGARMVAALVFQGVPDGRRIAQGAAIVGCLLIGIGWVRSLHSEADDYTGAFREDERVLNTIQTSIPKPVSGSTIWTFGQPVLYAPEIPVFANTWDMIGSVQLQYGDPTLRSLVALPGIEFKCTPDSVEPAVAYSEEEAPILASPYGKTYFINTSTGENVLIKSQAECEQVAGTYEPSPLLPPE